MNSAEEEIKQPKFFGFLAVMCSVLLEIFNSVALVP